MGYPIPELVDKYPKRIRVISFDDEAAMNEWLAVRRGVDEGIIEWSVYRSRLWVMFYLGYCLMDECLSWAVDLNGYCKVHRPTD